MGSLTLLPQEPRSVRLCRGWPELGARGRWPPGMMASTYHPHMFGICHMPGTFYTYPLGKPFTITAGEMHREDSNPGLTDSGAHAWLLFQDSHPQGHRLLGSRDQSIRSNHGWGGASSVCNTTTNTERSIMFAFPTSTPSINAALCPSAEAPGLYTVLWREAGA